MRWEKVFISYDVRDDTLVRTIARSLEHIGIEPFLANDHVAVGTKIGDKITESINDSNCFVPIITTNSVNSQWVNQEIAYAYAHSKEYDLGIFPVVENGVTPSGFIDKSREYVSMNRDNLEQTIYRLMAALREYINRNWDTLEEIRIHCKTCSNNYKIPLPTQQIIDRAVREESVFPSVCPKCKLQNNLDPRTLEISSSLKVAF
ncbi:MAG: toll/interleukin-1 receptor domain-containing protein [archaeon]|nr:toll/interleukin-1 receptor domain-containing protein [archaeon]